MSRNIIVIASIFCTMAAVSVVEAKQQRGGLLQRVSALEARIANLENKYRSAVASTCGRGQFVRGRNSSGTYKCAKR